MPASDYYGSPTVGILAPAVSSPRAAFGRTPEFVAARLLETYDDLPPPPPPPFPDSRCSVTETAAGTTFFSDTDYVIPVGQMLVAPLNFDFIVPVLPVVPDVIRKIQVGFVTVTTPVVPTKLWSFQWKWNSDGTKYDEIIDIVTNDHVVADFEMVQMSKLDSLPFDDYTTLYPFTKYTTVDAAGITGYAVPACAVAPPPPPPPSPSPDTWNIKGTDIKLANFARIFNPFGIRRK